MAKAQPVPSLKFIEAQLGFKASALGYSRYAKDTLWLYADFSPVSHCPKKQMLKEFKAYNSVKSKPDPRDFPDQKLLVVGGLKVALFIIKLEPTSLKLILVTVDPD